jgi:hypothetical protein
MKPLRSKGRPCIRLVSGSIRPSVQWVSGGSFHAFEQPRREPYHSPLSITKVTYEWNYASAPPYAYLMFTGPDLLYVAMAKRVIILQGAVHDTDMDFVKVYNCHMNPTPITPSFKGSHNTVSYSAVY